MSRPSIDNVTGKALCGASPRLVIPAVTARRSWPEKGERAKVIDGTDTLLVPGDATDTVVSVIPSGKCASSELVHPVFWKSLINTASRRLTGDRPRMLS